MSIQIVNSLIKYDSFAELEENYYNIEKHLNFFTNKHKDISYKIDMLVDTNELSVKTLMLQENVN